MDSSAIGSLLSPTQTGVSSIQRGFSNFSLGRRRSSQQKSEDTWGSFGLRLLYEPPDPLIDFIFVHGLRGGSTKTWCKKDDLRLFWPQAWLPREPDLQNVRVHSFGYNADWAETKQSIHDVHDFGRSLIGEMVTSPILRRSAQVSSRPQTRKAPLRYIPAEHPFRRLFY